MLRMRAWEVWDTYYELQVSAIIIAHAPLEIYRWMDIDIPHCCYSCCHCLILMHRRFSCIDLQFWCRGCTDTASRWPLTTNWEQTPYWGWHPLDGVYCRCYLESLISDKLTAELVHRLSMLVHRSSFTAKRLANGRPCRYVYHWSSVVYGIKVWPTLLYEGIGNIPSQNSKKVLLWCSCQSSFVGMMGVGFLSGLFGLIEG